MSFLYAGRHARLCRYPRERSTYIYRFTSVQGHRCPVSLSPSRRYGYTATNSIQPICQKSNITTHNRHPRRSALILSQAHSTTSQASVTSYTPPNKGLISYLPQSWIPYAELLRLDKPTGTYYLFFPCAYSTLLAASIAPSVSAWDVVGTTGLFFAGALIMRGAGCAINDLWDRNLDPHVERTKFRPIARGAIPPGKAVLFTGTQLLAGLGVLLQFPYQCLWYGIPSLLLVTMYPLAKRITYYPQAVLGLTFSWGAIMGFPALGIDLLHNSAALETAAALYASCVTWTVLYDMIYAHMDIKDDVAAGIKSIALRHEKNTKAVLSALAAVQVPLLAAAGVAAGSGPIFFIGSCGSAAVTLGLMIWKVQLKNVQNCWWWFKNGCLLTGGGITLGMFLDYVAKTTGFYNPDEEPVSLES
ncbi:4-hydroxybenzoate polyprenyl transferase [Aspergillus eucalypticola CBS 122712]|uniref:4-hydroxybenzoate polyprenyltransferase, mitochondrial n=1 Tax=Aspergillus eucalypticola (strain CBS 122712 / IBT 29274) TaxID=1448314 RepID=A0A317USN3_ASPEC|nr:4-hydroxybenzoate polyprenyl transferase [Aspergillus eucalypticola CBS 122712]PWY63527.1 4-hydroxybenzoate polyprenyl transferase [Aspergillus eucalypticola CBS 122712]